MTPAPLDEGIVERLNAHVALHEISLLKAEALMREAAAEITALRAQLAVKDKALGTARTDALEEAAKIAEIDTRSPLAKEINYSPTWHTRSLDIAAAIRARAALNGEKT